MNRERNSDAFASIRTGRPSSRNGRRAAVKKSTKLEWFSTITAPPERGTCSSPSTSSCQRWSQIGDIARRARTW
jgi:hypothetical protein